MGLPRRPTTKSASPWSLRRFRYSLTQLSARGLKKSTRSLLPLPMIVASPVWKLMAERFSDNASDIRAPVPRSTSTSTRKPSQSISYERGPFRRGIDATYCWTSSGVKNCTSRLGSRGWRICFASIGCDPHGELAEAEKRLQRREDIGDPRWPEIALRALGLDEEDVLLVDAPWRDIPQPADDPAHRILVSPQRPGRPSELYFTVAEEIRHELAERRLPLRLCGKR